MRYEDPYENAELYFPETMKKVVDSREISYHDIMFRLNDGDTILYNNLDKSIRTLPKNDRELSEDECKKEFGLRLQQIMLRKGVTQLELSERTGIPQPMLSNYMIGKNSPSFYKVDMIAKALDCSIDAFRYYWEK